jgi:hypothetical protein
MTSLSIIMIKSTKLKYFHWNNTKPYKTKNSKKMERHACSNNLQDTYLEKNRCDLFNCLYKIHLAIKRYVSFLNSPYLYFVSNSLIGRRDVSTCNSMFVHGLWSIKRRYICFVTNTGHYQLSLSRKWRLLKQSLIRNCRRHFV